MVLGANLLLETLKEIRRWNVFPRKQNDEESCYAKMLSKDMGWGLILTNQQEKSNVRSPME